jgi:DNA modification methylase
MGSNMILEGNCFDLIKTLEDNSVDLIITSPPYADIVNYGNNVSIKKPKEYCDWLLPIFNDIHRVLKPSGSFILNINDNCSNGLRNPFIYELIYRSQKETKLKFYDTYIWHKLNGIPNGSPKRFRNNTEFIFHFVKNQKELKFNMDRVMDNGVRPDNVFRFKTAGASRDNHIKHPAPFNKELPSYFINLLTDEGDIVLDIFGGIGTTNLAAKELNRQHISFELNPKYVEFGNKRIEGKELDNWLVCQYDLNDIFIKSWNSITEIEKTLGFNSHNHIEDCLRKGNQSAYGYKWKLEKTNELISKT